MNSWFNSHRILVITGLILLAVAAPGFFNVSGAQEIEISADQRVAVLTFHSVYTGYDPNPVVISAQELEKTFQLLLQNGYHPITLEQFHNFIDGKHGVPDRAVLFTFDDGYEDNYLLAYPLAKKYKIPAIVFAVTKWFTDYPRPEPHRPHLTREQVRTFVYEGLWTVGSHSHDGHRKLPGYRGAGSFYATRIVEPGYIESEEAYKARIWNDIALSAFVLESLEVKPEDFAFPYGSYNDTVKDILLKTGYKYLYTNEPGLNTPGQDPAHIRRIPSAPTAEGNLILLDRYFAPERRSDTSPLPPAGDM